MRFVIYDDETNEPITVINFKGLAEGDIERMGRHLLVPVPPRWPKETIEESATYRDPPNVLLRFERFVRKDYIGWMCFTRATELAMLLNPDWLPGQRPAVQELENQNAFLVKLLSEQFT